MKYVPHEYQRFATDFIVTHPTAAIFLDMGMGKSSITLTAIERLMYQEFEVRKVLIIAPLRVAKNTWPAEIQKWDHLNGPDLVCDHRDTAGAHGGAAQGGRHLPDQPRKHTVAD